MPLTKSDIIKKFKENYPNFYTKDIEKFTKIIFSEIKQALKRSERVELRNFGIFFTNIQKKYTRRNPKTGEKIIVPEKKTIQWRMSKEMSKNLNNEK